MKCSEARISSSSQIAYNKTFCPFLSLPSSRSTRSCTAMPCTAFLVSRSRCRPLCASKRKGNLLPATATAIAIATTTTTTTAAAGQTSCNL